MPDNLTVEISANTARLRTELAKAQADLRQFGKDLRKATESGETTRATELAASYEKTRTAAARLTRQLRIVHDTASETAPWAAASKNVAGLHAAFTRFGRGLTTMADKTFPAWRTALTVSLTGAAAGVAKLVSSANDSVDSLGDQADALGVSSEFVETYRQIAVKAGAGIDETDAAFGRLIKSLGEQRRELAANNQQFQSNVQVLKGGQQQLGSAVQVWRGGEDALKGLNTELQTGVKVYRAGQQAAVDYTDVWKAFGVDIRRIPPGEKGAQDAIAQLVKGFDAMKDRQLAASLAADAWGKNWRNVVEGMRNTATQWEATQKEITDGIGFTTEAMKEQANQYKIATGVMQASFIRIRNIVGVEIGTAVTKVLTNLNQRLQENSGAIKAWAESVGVEAQKVADDLIKIFNNPQVAGSELQSKLAPVLTFFRDLGTALPQVVSGLRMVAAGFTALANAINSVFGTNVSGGEVAVVVTLGLMTGAFQALAGALVLVGTALIPLLAAMGPVGWLVLGIVAINAVMLTFTDSWGVLAEGAKTAVAAIGEGLDWLWKKIVAVKDALLGLGSSKADYGGADIAGGAFPMARGGRVPGSGSGDTVPAMLTPGEFVNSLPSVRYYGADLFRALNARLLPRNLFSGYALGGLVDALHRPVRGFADGGMVNARTADGVPVHLHFPGGGQVQLHGDKAIVRSLLREARRAGMVSAGRPLAVA